MSFDSKGLDDYIDVAQRIADFRDKYPEGSLQPANPDKPWEQATITGYDKDGNQLTQTFIVYIAAAYRHPGDTRPGIGAAYEVFPGRTPYTRGSELMNAETSAWGRAIVAIGASDTKKGVRSRQEMIARELERADGLPVNRDGSLSRSRTDDAQKDAAGVMTSAQQSAHNKLERDTHARGPAAQRLSGPDPADPFTLDPEEADRRHADAEATQEPDTASPGTISPAQMRAIHMLCRRAGLEGDEEVREEIGRRIGRPVTTRTTLSYDEAAKFLAWKETTDA